MIALLVIIMMLCAVIIMSLSFRPNCLGTVTIHKTYFINLTKRIDKAFRTWRELTLSDHPDVIRFAAVDAGTSPSVQQMVSEHQNVSFDPRLITEERVTTTKRYRAKMGCWLSHYLVLKQHQHQSMPDSWVIVLEDDIRTKYSYHTLVKNMRRTVGRFPRADIIVLGNRIGICDKKQVFWQMIMYGKSSNFGSEAYAIRIRSIANVLPYLVFDHPHDHLSIDGELASLRRRGIITIVPLAAPAYIDCVDMEQKDSDIEVPT